MGTAELAEALQEERVSSHASGWIVLRVGSEEFELDGELRDAILRLVRLVASGQSVDIAAVPSELTTGQAADLLGVSRPTVVSLIDKGELPATRVGSRRRLSAGDVIAYRQSRRTTRRAPLADIVAASEALGLYDA